MQQIGQRESESKGILTVNNFAKGFLVDDQLMAGVAQNPEKTGGFLAFVLSHETGEYLGCHSFPSLQGALDAVNRIPRTWIYESSSGCKGSCGGCSKSGAGCASKMGCRKKGNCDIQRSDHAK